ncbi:MAG: P-II family nitrogen regulator [Bacteroidales bacterium]|nr:P-II family nitrogen regulator [Bacteroidales bacterium]
MRNEKILSIVVRDINVDRTNKTIIDSGKTGEVGDGKIFISAIEQSVRIRTGEEGDEYPYIKD